MAVTAVNIYQDNTVGDSNLMPIHSPLIFLVDVTFSSTAPELIYVDIIKDTVIQDTYQLIPWKDRSSTQRVFAFIANEPIKSLMGNFDDTLQLLESFEPVPDITYNCTLDFYDPDTNLNDTLDCVFVHGMNQFGEHPNLHEQYNNESETYYAAKDGIIYLYVFNNDITNDITVNEPTLTEVIALNFDDDTFVNYDDTEFSIIKNIE